MGLVRSNPWNEFANRAARIRREEGIWRLASRLCHRFLAPVVEWGAITFFEHRLDDDAAADEELDPAIREVSAPEIGSLAAGLDPTQPPDGIAGRFKRGDRAFAAFDDSGAAAHTRFLTTSRAHIPEIDRHIVLAPGQAYFYNGYTRPDQRRCGIDGRVRTRIFQTLRSENLQSVFSYVRHDNPTGFRAASRWQRPVGVVRYLRIAGSRPFVITSDATLPVRLHAAADGTCDETREQEWKRWFHSWQQRPLSARSTGCYEASEAALAAAAASIVSLLELGDSDDVLDLGCDSALISRRVAPHCRRFAGVDFMAEMLPQAVRVMPRRAAKTWFIAGDGRRLPIRDAAFDKAYCSGVLHTLPSEAHGLAMIEELIRVTAAGGTILLASVPDRRKRRANRLLVWRRASLAGKLTLPIRWALPPRIRQWARRVFGVRTAGPPAFLDYDCRALAQSLEARGMSCVLHDFPKDFPNLDFRLTRTNLVIAVRHRPAF